ncbi:4-hydroxy-tetrahydrodipicolinate synthase [Candidatus Nomurabacteria bacterium RIFOXYC2_FULL_36_8]|nr:MAG: Dihydrodipicolinate synthase [Candidatus Nomurabacteria bacterium GW2011_GWE2_36_115]KKP94477.1 MAG: Dihydrodipicolinate synthase [Candidatus Nomurabacteria bacterium GW2011_GWF2_36_126]KKP96939.1 MAG: Dihydrodipicolinate synthase [Candidatus Nomurabacteria bacterium GW2011_GWD2_36_14]KKP99457.1 MAG: Dihydrodipicolinate synthase [Candidatus Nomurabacteria bacterium GW2011_GWF2_36_19]KKQ05687.1 MAG: Dihydrodipicolinate synthase [Candidatus Nomurabacteria bacterium GW2011_GWF1_36_47]KKQ0
MNKYKGVWTAMITPFNEDGSIDWRSFDNLVERQVEAKVTGIIINGTTGESPTITDEECIDLIKRAKEKVADKCLIMAGTGTNNTKKSVEKTKSAEEAGADIVLLVNPYYNKPTQNGLYLHFKAIAESTSLPVFLYNIKGRTGVNLETDTLKKLANEVKNIVGVKEASGDLNQIKAVCELGLEDFVILSGDDNITLEIIKSYGADGVISVASNIVPSDMVSMVGSALKKDYTKAEEVNTKLADLFKILFIETNPIPVKYASYKMGLCQNIYRLPMCKIGEENGKQVEAVLEQMNIIK